MSYRFCVPPSVSYCLCISPPFLVINHISIDSLCTSCYMYSLDLFAVTRRGFSRETELSGYMLISPRRFTAGIGSHDPGGWSAVELKVTLPNLGGQNPICQGPSWNTDWERATPLPSLEPRLLLSLSSVDPGLTTAAVAASLALGSGGSCWLTPLALWGLQLTDDRPWDYSASIIM